MNTLDKDYAAGLFDKAEPPCLSLYQRTHRHHPENQQDPIRFKNLVKILEDSLLQQLPSTAVRTMLEPFQALANDRAFWNHTLDGLAVLSANGMFRVYTLQRPVTDLAVVANSFHVKPLWRILQSADRFQILAVSRESIKLFEGNRDALDEIEPAPGVPRTIKDALGEELTEPHRVVSSHGGVGNGHNPWHHGQGGKADEIHSDTERFFRAVDQAIVENHSRPSGLPLILAALPEHHHLFHKVSHNPQLLKESIDVHPDALASIDELRRRAWEVMEPRYLAWLSALVEEFGKAKPKGLAEDDLEKVALAIVSGRVGTLLVEANRVVPGQIDVASGQLKLLDFANPEVDDVLDDMGALATKMGGKVVIVPSERMPGKTGAAAIYRY